MKNLTTLKTSIHSAEQVWLRTYFVQRRKELGISQKALAKKMGVIASFIGKVETGDRRLDVVEFVKYCQGLNIDSKELISELDKKISCKQIN